MTALLRHTVFFMQLFNEKAGTEHHKMAGSQRGKDEVRLQIWSAISNE